MGSMKKDAASYINKIYVYSNIFFYNELNKFTALKFFENLNCSLIANVITQIRFVV